MSTIHHIKFRMKEKQQLDDLLRRVPFDTGCCGPVRFKDGTIHVDGFVTASQLAQIEAEGIELEMRKDLTEHLAARRAEVGKGDRFDGGRIAPKGLGIKK